jgi:hypothetical protein
MRIRTVRSRHRRLERRRVRDTRPFFSLFLSDYLFSCSLFGFLVFWKGVGGEGGRGSSLLRVCEFLERQNIPPFCYRGGLSQDLSPLF